MSAEPTCGENDADFRKAADARQPVTIDLLYSDMNGGQRTVTRLAVLPGPAPDGSRADGDPPPARWIASIGTHWQIDDHSST